MNFQKAMERAERELDDAEDHDYYIIIEKNVLVFLFLAAKQKEGTFLPEPSSLLPRAMEVIRGLTSFRFTLWLKPAFALIKEYEQMKGDQK
jgi:hypothetical protein